MDKVKLAKNRRNKPHIHKHGYITDKSVDTIKNWAMFAMEHLPDQSDVTRQLRAESGIELHDDFKILHFLMQESIDGSLSSTSFTKPVLGLEEVIQDLENVLDSKVCNLKFDFPDLTVKWSWLSSLEITISAPSGNFLVISYNK